MIRFIDVSGQIDDNTNDFAFYCTVKEAFLTFNGNQTWNNEEDFVFDFIKSIYSDHVERFTSLIHDKFKVEHEFS